MSSPTLKVAGVPEAFNDCWANADFSARDLTPPPEFIPHPGGSGSMLKSVQSGDVDLAFALTDCIVAAIENGAPVRLAGPLVNSPLTWAVIVAPNSTIADVNGLCKATWGVSRMGSGSHVMVMTLAKQCGWVEEPRFEVCGNFEGLRRAVREGRVDAFLWELYTTRPYEIGGEVKIVDGVPTPWGCFSVVVNKGCKRMDEVGRLIDAFLEAGERFLQSADSVNGITQRYGMSEEDAKRWISGVRYAEVGCRELRKEELEMTRHTLLEAGVISGLLFSGGIEGYYI